MYLSLILALFTMPTHQIWSCHVIQVANFEKCLSCLIIHKLSRGKFSTSEVASHEFRAKFFDFHFYFLSVQANQARISCHKCK